MGVYNLILFLIGTYIKPEVTDTEGWLLIIGLLLCFSQDVREIFR